MTTTIDMTAFVEMFGSGRITHCNLIRRLSETPEGEIHILWNPRTSDIALPDDQDARIAALRAMIRRYKDAAALWRVRIQLSVVLGGFELAGIWHDRTLVVTE